MVRFTTLEVHRVPGECVLDWRVVLARSCHVEMSADAQLASEEQWTPPGGYTLAIPEDVWPAAVGGAAALCSPRQSSVETSAPSLCKLCMTAARAPKCTHTFLCSYHNVCTTPYEIKAF